jgi:hypothetical protein
MDPLSVSGHPPAEETVAVGSRPATLVGLLAVAVAITLLWLLTPVDETPKAIPSESMAHSTLAPQVESTVTTTTPTTTGSPEPSPSTPLFVNDTPGPVLDEGITGTMIGLDRRELYRIDLATGAVEVIEVDHLVESGPPARQVIIDGELVTQSGETEIVQTDLSTGEQMMIEIDSLADDTWIEVLGPAGPETFWLGAEGYVYEVDLSGNIGRRVEVPEAFWVASTTEDHLYLEGPGGSFRYDTATGIATELPGAIGEPALQGSLLMIRCNERLECDLVAETRSGEVVLPGLDATDLWYGGMQVSPDLTDALVQHWDNDGPQLFHVDLATGDRTSIGPLEVELWGGATWIPGSRWVILGGPYPGESDWLAIDLETHDVIEIDVPGRTNRPSEFGSLILEGV